MPGAGCHAVRLLLSGKGWRVMGSNAVAVLGGAVAGLGRGAPRPASIARATRHTRSPAPRHPTPPPGTPPLAHAKVVTPSP